MGVHESDEIYAEIKDLLGIPQDEPVFILRGQDRAYTQTLKDYQHNAMVVNASEEFLKSLDDCRDEGVEFALQNPERMGTPD